MLYSLDTFMLFWSYVDFNPLGSNVELLSTVHSLA
jgi:hypothetical protein